MTFTKGESVILKWRDEQYAAQIALASPNGVSLALSFEAIVAGHVGLMPILLGEDGVYRSIITGDEVEIRRWS